MNKFKDEIQFQSDQAVKFDNGKPRLDLLSRPALIAISEVMVHGAKKYGTHNWRKGMEWSRLYSAVLRHLFSHLEGHDIDGESGMSHLAHAACGLMFLLEYEAKGLGTDDRFKT